MGLVHEKTKQALGIAEYHAPNAPMMRDIAHPTVTKHAIGWGAMNGVTSVELAQRGYTGIPSILGFEEYREWVADLGQTYWMADWVFYKEWCSCAWGHPACVAALQLVDIHGIIPDELAYIRVRVFEKAVMLHQGYPAATEEAQFSGVLTSPSNEEHVFFAQGQRRVAQVSPAPLFRSLPVTSLRAPWALCAGLPGVED